MANKRKPGRPRIDPRKQQSFSRVTVSLPSELYAKMRKAQWPTSWSAIFRYAIEEILAGDAGLVDRGLKRDSGKIIQKLKGNNDGD